MFGTDFPPMYLKYLGHFSGLQLHLLIHGLNVTSVRMQFLKYVITKDDLKKRGSGQSPGLVNQGLDEKRVYEPENYTACQ